MMTVLGIAIFFVGLLLSVAWHELGHFTTARWFGIKVPEFFVGFGRTVWSVKRGETEYGLKLIPLGGYVRMIGMLPPAKGGGTLGRSRRTGPFQGLMDDARRQSQADVLPADSDRQFWTRSPWKRIVVMFAGPFMNLILAVVLFAVALIGIGLPTDGTRIGSVSECVVPATAAAQPDVCPPGAPPTPAAAAGLRAGDLIVGLNGRPFQEVDGQQLREAIRVASGPAEITVERNGELRTLPVTVIDNQVQSFDDPNQTVRAGFLGVGLTQTFAPQSFGDVFLQVGDTIGRTGQAITQIPARFPGLFGAAFLGEERDQTGPMGVVGVSRLGGEILSQDRPLQFELFFFLQLLAAVNMSLFLLNLLPIPPLDGGQIVPAIWESIKRHGSRVMGRPDPGPVDAAKLLPVAYVFVMVFVAFSLVLVVADIVNPVRIFG
ncbi:M50 family metallopeptidase [Pseudonocardia endophytica]|uniref:RIP metalloprotease RseP n=1 Tax=Pseudonocardia endophytica TaxID=401976 RepID=A0A4R1HZ54_PSEEN|nr:site-2 protease family protein [Pseudonocardia endophytica]TCK25399.1 RIP metalloprotease RseP [Pseudonocardia endophytica]